MDALRIPNIASAISSAVSAGFMISGLQRLRHHRALAAYQQFDRALLVQIFVTQIFVFVESSFSALFGLLIAILLLITVRYLERRELEQARRGLMFSPAAEGPSSPCSLRRFTL